MQVWPWHREIKGCRIRSDICGLCTPILRINLANKHVENHSLVTMRERFLVFALEKQLIMFLLHQICKQLWTFPHSSLWSAISSTFYCWVESQTHCSINCCSRLWNGFTSSESKEVVSNHSLGKQNHLNFRFYRFYAQFCTPFVKQYPLFS